MSSLLSAINAAASGLDAQHARMEVAVSNMANADSTGSPGGGPYRRRDVILESMPSAQFGMDAVGGATGVRVAGVVEDQAEFQRRYEPTSKDADADGFVALPNVDVTSEMVNMTTAARAYQANLTAINLIRDTIQRALELGK